MDEEKTVKRPRSLLKNKSEDSKTKILNASLELFLEQGYEKTTTRQIIQRSGVLNGSLYHAFGNKEGIFKAISMKALDDALSESTKQLESNSNLLVALGYPAAVELYAASKSKSVAELLHHAHSSWDIMNGFIDITYKWVNERITDLNIDFTIKNYRRNILAVMGVLGKYIEEYYATNNDVPYCENLKKVIIVTCSLFNIPTFDVDGIVSRISEHVEAAGVPMLKNLGQNQNCD